ncbi:TCF25-like protein [Mya arenaria]|uniref:TCF25-like protein n=1 Tax=Mya arenaria TaxID=6604 RepID=A0ABY7ETM2_MYAAR|nr:TCF25-like protein [Mya arenaria]
MSSRALRKLRGNDLDNLNIPEDISDGEADSLGEEEGNQSDDENQSDKEPDQPEPEPVQPAPKKKRKKKKKKNKEQEKNDIEVIEGEDEIDAGLREVNQLLDNANIGEANFSTTSEALPCCKALLSVEHKNLNPDTELKRIFGSRVIREEGMRRRHQGRRRQKSTWLATPQDSWPPIGRTGLSMRMIEQRNGCQFFVFEHSHSYQKVQFQFYDAVESLNPQNIGSDQCMQWRWPSIHFSTWLQARVDSNINTGKTGQRGCNRTALEFCKLLLSLDPDNDPLCALLMIDFYAVRATDYEFLIRLYNEWEAHRNLSQLPNFAFSLALAYFLQAEGGDTTKADKQLQDSLLMFPGVLNPLLDKCGVQADSSASHAFFTQPEYCDPVALKQLEALYAGRCHVCWKVPDVLEWLETNVKVVLDLVQAGDTRAQTYKTKRLSRYKGTPRNIYRHILISEIPSATATLPRDVASTVLSYDPLPPVDSVDAYTRPARPNQAQVDGSAMSMFLRSLLPNFNPNEPVPEGAVGGDGQPLRQGVGALMDAMRDLLNNIQMVDHHGDRQEGGEEQAEEEDLQEWD